MNAAVVKNRRAKGRPWSDTSIAHKNPQAPAPIDEEGLNATPANRETIVTVAFLDRAGQPQHNIIRSSLCVHSVDMTVYKAALDTFYLTLGFTLLHVQVSTERSVVVQGVRHREALGPVQRGWARLHCLAYSGLAAAGLLGFDTWVYDII